MRNRRNHCSLKKNLVWSRGKVISCESKEFKELAERTRIAFPKKFYDPVKGSTGQFGADIFAIKMGVPDDQRDKVTAALKADILAHGGHLDTGIFGTQFFFEVLAENGLNELAYEALNKRTMPSYGYWLEQGATTSWEHFEKPGSGNHPMFGGDMVWLYRKLAGMNTDPDSPGYRNIIFRPQPPNDLTSAGYSNLTNYGETGIKWKKEQGRFTMEINVPVGTDATVYVPAKSNRSVLESGRRPSRSPGVRFEKNEDGYAVYKVGSGHYSFESR